MARRKQRLFKRQTVVSKTKNYKYRYGEDENGIMKRQAVKSGYGYEDDTLKKLSFRNGKLTKAGKELKAALEATGNEEAVNDFMAYVKERHSLDDYTTVASYESHLIYEADRAKYELEAPSEFKKLNGAARWRMMLNNLNTTEDEIKQRIKRLAPELLPLYEAAEKADEEAGNIGNARSQFLSKFTTWSYTDAYKFNLKPDAIRRALDEYNAAF